MRKDFRSFTQQSQGEEYDQSKKNQKEYSSNQQTQTSAKNSESKADDIISAYKGKSESDILGDIFKVASAGKKDGSVDMEQVENFARTLSPNLNREQQKKLDSVLKMLKNM